MRFVWHDEVVKKRNSMHCNCDIIGAFCWESLVAGRR